MIGRAPAVGRPSRGAGFAIGVALCVLVCIEAAGQDRGPQPAGWTVKVTPGLLLPAGADREVYASPGFSAAVAGTRETAGRYRPYAGLSCGYAFAPVDDWLSLSIFQAGLTAGVRTFVVPRGLLDLHAGAGYFHATLDHVEGQGSNPYLKGGLGLSWALGPTVLVGADVDYASFSGLYRGLEIGLGIAYRVQPLRNVPPIAPRPDLPHLTPLVGEGGSSTGPSVVALDLPGIFPALFSAYNELPVGSVTIRNSTQAPITGIEISFFVRQYMESPRKARVALSLAPGEEARLDLNALFTRALLEVTEGSQVPALLSIDYDHMGSRRSLERSEAVRVHGRNAICWDDDRKAAAFVTATDVAVLRLGKLAAGVAGNSGNRAVDRNLQTAMVVHESLSLRGINYVADPVTPHARQSRDAAAVDFVQFPAQTLDFKGGDCDDLSVLYSALLESVGIETALITVPGHILAAVALERAPEEALRGMPRAGDLIVAGGRAWVPVEATSLTSGFLKAWELGARRWREHEARGEARLIPVREAWKVYEPVPFVGQRESAALPPEAAVRESFAAELSRLIAREIQPREEALRAELASRGNEPELLNRLAVLYARHGLDERAEAELQKVLRLGEYGPSLTNMGNIRFRAGDAAAARYYYERAHRCAPSDPRALLNLMRASQELGDAKAVAALYESLKIVDAQMAERFARTSARSPRSSGSSAAPGGLEWDD